ncbi:lysostaphin resistance A-like protein [Marinifilum sp. RC60d5]|uniref:lysostaphin resistance A-like protein n=1 Tax=Marinifilum sp. RC60d5 TaxID=3458414 RepID=UPI004036F418
MKGWHRILLIIIPYFIIVGIFQLIGGLIADVDFMNLESERNSIQQLILSLFNLFGHLLVIWLFMKFIDEEPFVKLGFQTKNRLSDFIAGIVIGLVIMILGFIILVQLEEIQFIRFNFDIKELIFLIIIYVIVAIVEEILIRGYILRNLMDSINKYVALVISAIIFSLMHSFNPSISTLSLLDLFLAGLVLGLSYIYTRNLWFPIAMHLSWNLFQSLLGFNVSGQETYSIVEFKIYEGNLLNGGAFGFEGSILSVTAEILTIIGIGLYFHLKHKKTNHNTV